MDRETPSATSSVSSKSRGSDRFVSAGAASCAAVRSLPLMGSTAAERLVALAISSARQTLFISSAYFVPTVAFTRLLLDAARRGVDVRVLTNGRSSDVRTTWLAGRHSYEPLLRGGVRIYEYSTTLHAKTFVVDSRLTAIGTINFDNRSLARSPITTKLLLSRSMLRRANLWTHSSSATSATLTRSSLRPSVHGDGHHGSRRV